MAHTHTRLHLTVQTAARPPLRGEPLPGTSAKPLSYATALGLPTRHDECWAPASSAGTKPASTDFRPTDSIMDEAGKVTKFSYQWKHGSSRAPPDAPFSAEVWSGCASLPVRPTDGGRGPMAGAVRSSIRKRGPRMYATERPFASAAGLVFNDTRIPQAKRQGKREPAVFNPSKLLSAAIPQSQMRVVPIDVNFEKQDRVRNKPQRQQERRAGPNGLLVDCEFSDTFIRRINGDEKAASRIRQKPTDFQKHFRQSKLIGLLGRRELEFMDETDPWRVEHPPDEHAAGEGKGKVAGKGGTGAVK